MFFSSLFLPLLAAANTLLSKETLKSLTLFRDGVWFKPVAPAVWVSVLAIVASIWLGVMLAQWLRLRDFAWKFSLILVTWTVSIAIILFGQFKLGVDLQQGVTLVYEVDSEATKQQNPDRKDDAYDMSAVCDIFKRRLNPDGLKEMVIRPFGPKQFEIVVPEVDPAEIAKIKDKIVASGALEFMIVADSEIDDEPVRSAAKQLAAEPGRELDLVVKNNKGDVIGVWVELDHQLKDGEKLEDHPDAPFRVEGMNSALLRNHATGEILDLSIEDANLISRVGLSSFLKSKHPDIRQLDVLLKRDPKNIVRGEDLAHAEAKRDLTEGHQVHFEIKPAASVYMGNLTAENRKNNKTRHLAVVFDGKLKTAPVLQDQLTDQGRITGGFTEQQVKFMVELLKSGSLPVVLKKSPLSENVIGATLGQDTINKGAVAVIVSLLVVLVFVVIYYRFAGFVACAALVLNILLTVAIMIILQAPFTLPGLAGIVLTVGMSVDANVLIYERIREETERGAGLRMALRNGFDRAMTTIIDSNLTTLLTAVVLYFIGTDQVRGFGVTLILGILTSMYTAIFCARVIFEAGERTRLLKSLTMMKMFSRTHWDWCKLFPPAVVVSLVFIVAGLIATGIRGVGILDIDLAGGTSVSPLLDKPMEDAEIRRRLDAQFSKETDPKTNGQINYSVNNMAIAGEPKNSVWRIDCSLTDYGDFKALDKLKAIVIEALRDPSGKSGLRSGKLEVASLEEKQIELESKPAAKPSFPAGDDFKEPSQPEKIAEPAIEKDSPAEKPAAKKPLESKSAEGKPADAKPAEGKPAEGKPAEGKPAEGKPATDVKDAKPAETPKEPAAKEPEKEKAADSPKVASSCDDPPSDPKTADAQTADAKTDDAKDKESKPATAKEEKSSLKEQPAAKEKSPIEKAPVTAAPPTEPAEEKTKTINSPVDPPAASAVPAAVIPPSPSTRLETVAVLNFPGNKITKDALDQRLSDAAAKVLNRPVSVKLANPLYDPRENQAFETWTATFRLNKDQTQRVIAAAEKVIEEEPVWQSSTTIQGQVTLKTQLTALTALLVSFVGIVAYIWVRFQKLSWGIAAVVALVHDTLVMLGAIAFSYWLVAPLGFLQVEEFKISLTVVAAFLTLVGYSINDTIVIFDRIREVKGKSPDLTKSMINDSVNQTLSRSILTAGTVFMTVIVLYFLGGPGIHAFAFSMVVGVIAGTYSSVYIAAPLLLWMIGKPDVEPAAKPPEPIRKQSAPVGR